MTDANMISAFVAISQVKARYCRLVDSKDWAGLAGLFTEDFELNVPRIDTLRGRDNAIAFISNALADATTAHQVHLPEIELDGEEAKVIWAMQDRNTWDPPRNGVSTQRGFGQYHERYVLVDGQWKIAAQRLVYLHLDING
jgi:hypothetical protein